jgi:hypothetical protein
MKKTTVSMPTVTHAIKAKRFLASQGYSCELRRLARPSETGCTHIIVVNGDRDVIAALLKKHRIEFGKILE